MQHDTRCACKVLRIRRLVTWPGTMAGRRLREHFAALWCVSGWSGGGGGGSEGGDRRGKWTKPSLRLSDEELPSSYSSYDKSRECISRGWCSASEPHDAVGLCYLSTGCRIAHHKIIGERGVRACTAPTKERDREQQEQPNNEVPFLARAIGSLVNPCV